MKCLTCLYNSKNPQVFVSTRMDDRSYLEFRECESCKTLQCQEIDRSSVYSRSKDNTNYSDNQNNLVIKLKAVLMKSISKTYSDQALNKNSVLDFGTGSGELANAFLHSFQKVYASDLFIDRPQKLHKDVEYYSFADKSLNQPMDLIVLRHVLEHVEDLDSCLVGLKKIISHNSTILIEVPNSASIHRKYMRGYWTGYFAPYHTFVFSRLGLQELLTRHDFQVEFKKAEPFIFGVYFLQLGLPLTISRVLSIFFYPIQFLISKVFRSSEAIVAIARLKE